MQKSLLRTTLDVQPVVEQKLDEFCRKPQREKF
ncbi:MAG: hypothetical protein J07AB43_05260 [Candidatus Nanosalina sp. J07AB43]|nr:MAG: hypothetical protein J07AB43_05260 [Candidatus Nanosalina sp. J07AB43]